jgi:hypothetical protein
VLGLIAESDGPKAHEPAAGIAHVPDILLVSPGGRSRAELTAAVDIDY